MQACAVPLPESLRNKLLFAPLHSTGFSGVAPKFVTKLPFYCHCWNHKEHDYNEITFTLWCLKNVESDIAQRFMCLKICITFEIAPPASNVAMLSSRLPAGIFVPVIWGWLFQIFSFIHLGLMQKLLTMTNVPHFLASTLGLSDLQKWQNLNNNKSWLRNTINFGSVRKFPSIASILRLKRWKLQTSYTVKVHRTAGSHWFALWKIVATIHFVAKCLSYMKVFTVYDIDILDGSDLHHTPHSDV